MEKLSETSLMILDCVLNIRSISDPENVFVTLSFKLQKKREDLKEEWTELVQKNIVTKTDHQWIINPSHNDEVKKQLEEFLRGKDITPEYTTALLEDYIKKEPAKLSLLIKTTGKISEWEQGKYIVFSDYDWNTEVISFCEELVKNNMMFIVNTSSRKHYYRSFYFRIQPFDSSEIIRAIVLKHLNIGDLTSEEWKIISLLLFSPDLSLEYEILKINTEFTEPELRETLTNLERKGLMEETYQKISLPQGLKEPLTQYFKINIYPKVKSDTMNNLKQRISRALSNLSIFMNVKRIYELSGGETKSEPFLYKFIRKTEIQEYESILPDMRDLNLVLDFKDQILILADIVKDTETWLKSSIESSKKSVLLIPAKDTFAARRVLQNIFSECEEYVKIQDGHLGEETFLILQYIPRNIKISLLTGLKLGWGEDSDRVCKCIDRLKTERKMDFEVHFIGNPRNKEPPFHYRCIISRNKCWLIDAPLKQIGKGKDVVISEFSKSGMEKITEIVESGEPLEPAFDYWWKAEKEDLDEKNLAKVDYNNWKNLIAPK